MHKGVILFCFGDAYMTALISLCSLCIVIIALTNRAARVFGVLFCFKTGHHHNFQAMYQCF